MSCPWLDRRTREEQVRARHALLHQFHIPARSACDTPQQPGRQIVNGDHGGNDGRAGAPHIREHATHRPRNDRHACLIEICSNQNWQRAIGQIKGVGM
jgi:hypothetical protein